MISPLSLTHDTEDIKITAIRSRSNAPRMRIPKNKKTRPILPNFPFSIFFLRCDSLRFQLFLQNQTTPIP